MNDVHFGHKGGESMKCVKCGAELVDGAIYCHLCGKKQVKEPRRAIKRANGTGTVYKLAGRRRRPWVACKNKNIIGYYETRTAALEALERLSGRALTDTYNMTFSEVYEHWKVEHFKTITPSSQQAFRRSYDYMPTLHARKFRDLRTSDFQAALDAIETQSYATLAKVKQLLTQMSRWAKREEIIATDFATFVQLPEKPGPSQDIFTEKEIQQLEADGSETARIVLMLIGTGMRINELFLLPLKDYHETYCIGGEKTEAGRNRIIPIRPEAREHFAYFAERATGALLLSGYEGCRDSNNFRARNYKQLLASLKIPYKKPHATRHTYASRAVTAGMRPEILQKILGHVDYATTANIYVHGDIEELVAAVEK